MFDIAQFEAELFLFLHKKEKRQRLTSNFIPFARKKNYLTETNNTQIDDKVHDELNDILTHHNTNTFKDKINAIFSGIDPSMTKEQKERAQATQSELAEKIGLTRQAVYKILSYSENTIPTKKNLLKIALVYHLSYEQTIELLAYANYAINPSNLSEKIIAFCIRKSVYDIEIIRNALAKIKNDNNISYLNLFDEDWEKD